MEEKATIGEVLTELRDLKERVLEFHVQTNQHFTTIDASLSSLAPMITAHEERFKTVEANHQSVCGKISRGTMRIDRLEVGLFSVVFATLAGLVLWVWGGVASHIFPTVVK